MSKFLHNAKAIAIPQDFSENSQAKEQNADMVFLEFKAFH